MAAKKSLNEDYKSDGKWKEIWRRFKKNKGAVIGLVLLVVLTVILVGAPLFISYDKAITQNMDLMLAKPSVGNLFGNDGYGRDIFARIIYGGRVSIAIAILATISSCLFGSLLGAVAGYFGGKVDSIIMRSLDIFMSVPDILFTMAVVYALGASFTNLIIALTLAYFTNYVRLVRSEVLTLSEQDYVEAAKAGGSSGFRIILSHIIPNAIGVIIVNTTLNIAKIIILGPRYAGPPAGVGADAFGGSRIYEKSASFDGISRTIYHCYGLLSESYRRWSARCVGPAFEVIRYATGEEL